jgi:CAAX protease family protein
VPQDDPQYTQSTSPAISAFIAEMERFPVWTLGDVAKIAGIFVLALIFSIVLGLMIASGLPSFKGEPANALITNAPLTVATELLAYLITFWFVYRLIVSHYGISFMEGIRWRWPRSSWPLYLLIGIALSVTVLALAHVLPQPGHVPFQDFFRTRGSAWILTIFGLLIAPPAEELFFRGLLFPALRKKLNLLWSVLITALAFTALHGSQYGYYWSLLIGMFIVGAVLTLVRERANSLAASVIVHVAYNGLIFVVMIYETQGFKHLEKITG